MASQWKRRGVLGAGSLLANLSKTPEFSHLFFPALQKVLPSVSPHGRFLLPASPKRGADSKLPNFLPLDLLERKTRGNRTSVRTHPSPKNWCRATRLRSGIRALLLSTTINEAWIPIVRVCYHEIFRSRKLEKTVFSAPPSVQDLSPLNTSPQAEDRPRSDPRGSPRRFLLPARKRSAERRHNRRPHPPCLNAEYKASRNKPHLFRSISRS